MAILFQLHRGEGEVIVQRAVVQAAVDDLLPQRVEIVADELRDLLLDEIGEDLRAGVVALGAELGLRLGAQEGLTDELAVELHLVERVAEQRAARGHQMLRAHRAEVAGKVLTAEPFAHEADVVSADVLVRDEHVRRVGACHDLLEQQVRLRDLEPRGERPVGANALGLQTAAGVRVRDGRVLEAARRDQTPQPRNALRHDLQHTHHAVVRVLRGARRHPHAEAAHIDLHRLGVGHDVVEHLARQDDARVRAGLAVRLDDVLPDQAGRAGDAVHVEEHQRLARMDADALVERVVAVGVHAVHAQKPAVLGVEDAQLAARGVLNGLERAGHIVGNGVDLAALAERHIIFFARDRMGADEQTVVVLAVEVLEHLALTAAARALVHEHDLVFIRRLDHRGARMAADPALMLADVEQ